MLEMHNSFIPSHKGPDVSLLQSHWSKQILRLTNLFQSPKYNSVIRTRSQFKVCSEGSWEAAAPSGPSVRLSPNFRVVFEKSEQLSSGHVTAVWGRKMT